MKLFLSFTLCLGLAFCLDSDAINMITSFSKEDERATSILAPYVCWSPHEMASLAKSLREVGVNAARSLQPRRTEYYLQNLLILADLGCEGTQEFLIKASDEGFFKSPYRWLLITKNSEDLDILDGIVMLIDSDVVLAQKTNNGYQLIEVYKIIEKSKVIFNTRSVWRPNNRILANTTDGNTALAVNDKAGSVASVNKYGVMEDLRASKVLSTRRMDIRKHTLTMVNVITDSNETRKHMDDRLQLHQDSITKMSYMMVKICFEMMNSTEKLIFTNTWGYVDKNGSWNGIVERLIKKEGDIGTLTIFTQERMQSIDYIAMVGTTAVRFVFREPPLAYVSNIFALPFTGAVWLAIFVCVIACALFLYITSKWEATMGMHPLQLDGSWADVLILTIGAVLQQGCTLEPRHAAGRVVTLLLFVALTILYAAYSANIVVLLRAPSSSVRSLQDILNSPLKLGASDFAYNRYFFKKLNEPLRKAIYNKKIAPKGKKANFYTMKEGVEKIRKGLFAFHMELNPGYRLIQETYQEDEKCDLVEIDYINEIDPWLPGQKRSPYKDLFKINFIKIRESGIQACIHQRLHVGKPRCLGAVNTFSSVGITDMYPAMLATLYGMLLAPAALLLEIAYKRLMVMREKRKGILQSEHDT
ncbi:ionotropic receptor 75a-like isoform X1 [Choristoneura fumiferana]|uniref:ionotropic receptor 75a-like isoform X1 n=2 Tax=Choristoneura fumiferana TaxID=7141 RepID=UPI003D15B35B